ncbi:hypothetical protein HYG86_12915 [Alkalicella caledoniensis]|uniref:ABC3 transporter permease C-terminal domain-containing protein n=1 Tax=Alkalicella caledoniensis TaxID=2731377 RepID=A0A7G9WA97_ALKCA|nr:ABC transporter permease [Alkalicella caledoniensis]QNO15609.1 hypothetical protein HYG86_12915 [Alkalicella caledoniensis]
MLKNTLSLFKKNPVVSKAIILQICISLIAFFFVGGFIENIFSNYSQAKSFMGNNTIIRDDSFSSGPQPDFNEVYTWLSNNPSIKAFGTSVEGFAGMNELRGYRHLDANSINYGVVTLMHIDKPYLEADLLNIAKGRSFNDNDFSNDLEHIPVIITHRLGLDYDIGTIFHEQHFNLSFEVVGILDSNQKFLKDLRSPDGYEIVEKLDVMMFAPLAPSAMNNISVANIDDFVQRFSNFFVAIHDNVNIDKFIDEINAAFNNHFSFTTLENYYYTGIKNNLSSMTHYFIFLGVMLTITMIGLLGTLLESVDRRKNEFGVRIALGATLTKISLDFYKDVFNLFLISTVLVSFIYIIVAMLTSLSIGYITILSILLLVLLLSVLICLYPIFSIYKIEVVKLLDKEL